eukprot:scaffold106_cov380-Prasinococcus_capsulatus_cf.AAC.32
MVVRGSPILQNMPGGPGHLQSFQFGVVLKEALRQFVQATVFVGAVQVPAAQSYRARIKTGTPSSSS